MIAGGLLTAAYVFKVLRHAFLQSEQGAAFRPLPRMLEWPAFLLVCANLVQGLLGTP